MKKRNIRKTLSQKKYQKKKYQENPKEDTKETDTWAISCKKKGKKKNKYEGNSEPKRTIWKKLK